MRLLKYPLDLPDGESLNAMTSINDMLVLLSNNGHVVVWSQQRLIDTAFDKLSIKDLQISSIFNVEFNEETFFISSQNNTLFIGSEHKLIKMDNWQVEQDRRQETMFECVSPTAITDIKLDTNMNILFILCSNPNSIILFDSIKSKKLEEIKLDANVKPITCVIDPSSNIFTIFCSDRSVLIYQFNNSGSFKLLNTLYQFVQVHPLHYKISMPPQANLLPVINSVKSTSSTSVTATVLLDRNENYKISSTIVSPSSSTCKVLAYSPVIYEKKNLKKNTKIRYNLLATSGSSTGTILVWNSKRMKPLFNAVQVSETPINDMVWSDQGYTLFAISDDNILHTFAFQNSDLGETLSHDVILSLRQENKTLNILPPKESEGKIDKKNDITVKLEDDQKGLKNEFPISRQDSMSSELNGSKKGNKQTSLDIPGVKHTKGSVMEFNQPSYKVPKDLKRKPKVTTTINGDNMPKKQKKELEHMDFLDTGLLLPNVSFSRIRLASPKIRLAFKYSPPNNSKLEMSIKNGTGNEQQPSVISLKSKISNVEHKMFEDFIPKFITLCTAGDFFWACSSEDGTIYIYSDSGKRLLPPLILGVTISFLEASGDYLLCVTSLGELYCWDIKNEKLKFPSNSVFPILNPALRYSDDILTRAENITMCAVTQNGVPLITLSNGDGYMFDSMMETWLLVSDGWWAYGSQYWDMNNTSNLSSRSTNNDNEGKKDNKFWNSDDIQSIVQNIKSDDSSIVKYIERKTNDELNRKSRIKNLQRFARAILMKEGFEDMEEIVTLSHLENRILVALRLEEAKEVSSLIVLYCVRLSELGYVDRLDDMLQWVYNGGQLDSSLVTGVERKDLLKEILVACAKIRHVQRVTTNYASALGLISEVIS